MTIRFARAEKLGMPFAALAALALALILVLCAAPARAGDVIQIRLFGSAESANADITPFPKWTGVLDRYAQERRLEDLPCTGHCPLQQWKSFVRSLEGQDRMRQLEAVNAYVNRTPYQTDMGRYGVVDYWATPREFLGRSGDCEDYAIAKYLSLRKLGWAAGELRVAIVKDESRNELHAVLIAYVGGTGYVLDNLVAGVHEHATIRHYRPIFSINETAWYFHRDWNPNSVAPVARTEPRPLPDAQIAGAEPSAIDTARPARIAPAVPARAAAAPARAVHAQPLVRAAARSYAGGAQESIAELFSNAGSYR